MYRRIFLKNPPTRRPTGGDSSMLGQTAMKMRGTSAVHHRRTQEAFKV